MLSSEVVSNANAVDLLVPISSYAGAFSTARYILYSLASSDALHDTVACVSSEYDTLTFAGALTSVYCGILEIIYVEPATVSKLIISVSSAVKSIAPFCEFSISAPFIPLYLTLHIPPEREVMLILSALPLCHIVSTTKLPRATRPL